MSFGRSVFINCPFDDQYLPILRPIIFCVFHLGLEPRIALASLDSGQTRLSKIIALIRQSRFAIHDLSRLKADKAGDLFRLNMPFELGLDVGCREFQTGEAATKKCLILEKERYRFQAAISDLSNSDIAVHGDDPARAMKAVRDWLAVEVPVPDAQGPAYLWSAFNDFTADHYGNLVRRGYSPEDVAAQPISELIPAMKGWLHPRVFGPAAGLP